MEEVVVLHQVVGDLNVEVVVQWYQIYTLCTCSRVRNRRLPVAQNLQPPCNCHLLRLSSRWLCMGHLLGRAHIPLYTTHCRC